ncbi:DNA-directed RNA polymerase II [Actinoplanes sp. NPDC051851]|uniref:DNA-directed RNA polymerase II n=1 Tax=Actinoplanes sp. NPDC051851 TaxID=3154753 RepID=UPI003416EA9A
MPEQPQWSERTLDMPPQDPWADPPTVQAPAAPQGGASVPTSPAPPRGSAGVPNAPTSPAQPAAPEQSPFSRGRATVSPRTQQYAAEHEPTGTGWPDAEPPRPHRPLAWHIAQWRRGGEWTTAALLFAFVCWGIWALSSGGDLGTAFIVFVVALLVGVGVFALCRLVGRVVWEQRLGHTRHSARGSHLVTALYLVGVGFAHLRQTDWVMSAFHWVVNVF